MSGYQGLRGNRKNMGARLQARGMVSHLSHPVTHSFIECILKICSVLAPKPHTCVLMVRLQDAHHLLICHLHIQRRTVVFPDGQRAPTFLGNILIS